VNRVTEIARILGCTGSNICYLLRRGRIKGKKISGRWVVSDEAVQDYMACSNIQSHHIKNKLHKGQNFGYWTVLEPDAERSKSGQRMALVQCICGKIRKVRIVDLVYGHSRSCGCRRAENPSQGQQKGREKGHEILKQIQKAGFTGRYLGRQINKNSHSGHTGVCWRENMQKYYAYIMVDRKQIPLGHYEKVEDAIAARKAAEEKYFRPRQEKVDAIKKQMKD
jgi:hypothetical protein